MHTPTSLSKSSTGLVPAFLLVASIIVILAGMMKMSDLINMTLISFLIALFSAPLIGWLRNKGLSKSLALFITILTVFFSGITLILFIGLSLFQLITALPQYLGNLDAGIAEATNYIENSLHLSFSTQGTSDSIKKIIDISLVYVSSLISNIATIVFSLLLISYMLYESLEIKTKLKRGFKNNRNMLEKIYKYGDDVQRYILISAKMGALVAGVDIAFFLLLGIDFALLWGILSFFMSFIPTIGFVIAIIPPTLMAFVQYGWQHAVVTFVGIWIINGTVDQLIKPKQMGDGLKISPLVVFWSILFWGFILGPIGGLVAVPLAVGTKNLILDSSEQTKPLADLMSDK